MTARPDITERLHGALVQHGPLNDRAYLMKPGPDARSDLTTLDGLAKAHGYTKLFAKVPEEREKLFREGGYEVEARVPVAPAHTMAAPFAGDASRARAASADSYSIVFCSRFLDPERARERTPIEAARVLEAALAEKGCPRPITTDAVEGSVEAASLPEIAGLRLADSSDAPALARLYGQTFESYPFPLDEPGFLKSSMSEGTLFAVAADGAVIHAAASCEPDETTLTCEMTDFATSAGHRGRGLARSLLHRLSQEALRAGLSSAYTIARAVSPGMNLVFARAGYTYAGTLVNNTHICGRIESMNVWHRPLR